MKNVWKGISIGLGIVGLLTVVMYLGLSWYYIGEFSYNTWINGIYCTGKSVTEVNQELSREFAYEGLTVKNLEGDSYLITAAEIGLTGDFTESLEFYKERQNPYLWIDHLFAAKDENRDKKIAPQISFDEAALTREIKELPFVRRAAARMGTEVGIRKFAGGYLLINNRENVLDREKVEATIRTAIEGLEPEVDLQAAGCYTDLPLDTKMQREIALWPEIQEFQDCKIVYQMGAEQVPIDASVVSEWFLLAEDGGFLLDETGTPQLDEEKVKAFVAELAAEYDTLGGTRQFQATRGELVTVTGGIYGNQLDQEAETAYLLQAFREKRAEVHTPTYLQAALHQGKADIGDTYIEIDMTTQMMYYYEAGERIIETPVVTGNTALRRGTPEGVNYVYAKQRNRVLRGEDYASPVKYWMPVKGAVGIHDASWRSRYGGEIYKNNGSHGCINTPFEAVKQLYERVEIGTPCVMFY